MARRTKLAWSRWNLIFTFSVHNRKYHFYVNLVQKIKNWNSNMLNSVVILAFFFYTGNNLSEQIWSKKPKFLVLYETVSIKIGFSLKSTFLCNTEMSKNSKNLWKLTKIDNIDREIFHNFWTSWEISMKLSGKLWLVITLKVTKSQVFTFYLEDTLFKKPQDGGESNSARFRVKLVETWHL